MTFRELCLSTSIISSDDITVITFNITVASDAIIIVITTVAADRLRSPIIVLYLPLLEILLLAKVVINSSRAAASARCPLPYALSAI